MDGGHAGSWWRNQIDMQGSEGASTDFVRLSVVIRSLDSVVDLQICGWETGRHGNRFVSKLNIFTEVASRQTTKPLPPLSLLYVPTSHACGTHFGCPPHNPAAEGALGYRMKNSVSTCSGFVSTWPWISHPFRNASFFPGQQILHRFLQPQ
jgi:hypothetical protein